MNHFVPLLLTIWQILLLKKFLSCEKVRVYFFFIWLYQKPIKMWVSDCTKYFMLHIFLMELFFKQWAKPQIITMRGVTVLWIMLLSWSEFSREIIILTSTGLGQGWWKHKEQGTNSFQYLSKYRSLEQTGLELRSRISWMFPWESYHNVCPICFVFFLPGVCPVSSQDHCVYGPRIVYCLVCPQLL